LDPFVTFKWRDYTTDYSAAQVGYSDEWSANPAFIVCQSIDQQSISERICGHCIGKSGNQLLAMNG
jgi:hypothetical protein